MHQKTFTWEKANSHLRQALLSILSNYSVFCYLDSNEFYGGTSFNSSPEYHSYDLLAGAGSRDQIVAQKGESFESLKTWLKETQSWCFGHLGYDLKNEIEDLSSSNPDSHFNEDLHFFIPQWVVTLKGTELTCYAHDFKKLDELYNLLFEDTIQQENCPETASKGINFKNQLSESNYVQKTRKLIQHIEEGDIYEVNFCQEFYASDSDIDPYKIFKALMEISPTPFACFYRYNQHYVISASMERFLKKQGNQLISQPIKGTVKRGNSKKEDEALKEQLSNDKKEKAENVMIVDLVRNDLAKSAVPGSVKVDELFGIYPFPTVHQMISTVSAEMDPYTDKVDAIKNAFPMGSMTGAPKVSAMELIDKYESFKRGIFSGAIGYFTPEGDFDFNVVIRSFLYNEQTHLLSLPVGSAITYDAIPEQEFKECMVKIEKLKKALMQ